jgi:LuxR family maltose regulon positive regulatory protein
MRRPPVPTVSSQTPSRLIHLVGREVLIRKLDGGRGRRLTLVQAPVGFGKTTLIMQWRRQLEAQGVRVAWVALHEDAWTPELLLHTIVSAVRATGLAVRPGAPLFVRRKVDGWRSDLDSLLESLEQRSTPTLIVLDEYEHAENPAIDQAVTQLLTRLPSQCQLVITSRQRPSLPIARLHADDQVTFVGADDLRLSASETAELLQHELDADGSDRVHRLTEGWVALVQLARLWLTGGGRPADVLDALKDPREEMARFLAEQVLTVLPDDERDFLVETSFLDRFDVSLADHVRDRDDSTRFLDTLAKLYPLVSSEAEGAASIRVHPLLRAEARHMLTLRGRSAVAALQRRAAEWLASHRDVYGAMWQALGAGDPELAADLYERCGGIRVIDAEGPPLLERIVSILPKQLRSSRPRLELVEIALLAVAGKCEEARAAFADLARRTHGFTRAGDPDAAKELRTDSLVVQMFIHVFGDDTMSSALLREFEALDLGNPNEDLRLRSFIASFLAVSHLQRGELPAALRAVGVANAIIEDPARAYQGAFPAIYEGVVDQISGRPDESLEKLDSVIAMTEGRLGAKGNLALLTALSVKSEVLLDLGRLDDANALLHRAQSEFSPTGWFDVYAPQLRVRYTLAFLSGGLTAALPAIDRCAEFIPLRSDRLENLLRAHRADARVRAGESAGLDLDDLQRHWEQLRSVPSTATWRELDALGLAYARTAIALQQVERAQEVIDALELLAVQHQWRRTLVGCHTASAAAHLALGEAARATQAMIAALTVGAAHVIRSPFLLEGDSGVHLIALATEELPAEHPARSFGSGLLQARTRINVPARLPFLTPREHLVLSQLRHGHPNKVIARKLGVSENTVKTHLKSIFRKADLQSREQAIELARRHIDGL